MGPQTAIAREIAREAHSGQEHFFGDGEYFDMHLEPIATNIERLGFGDLYIATGYTHDLFEDTDVTADDLLDAGIHLKIIQATGLLDATKALNHQTYLRRISASRLATVAKFADSSFNFSWTMLNSPSPKISDDNFRDWGLEYVQNLSFLLPRVKEIMHAEGIDYKIDFS